MAMAFVMLTRSSVVRMPMLVTTTHQQPMQVTVSSPMATARFVTATVVCLFRTQMVMVCVMATRLSAVRTIQPATTTQLRRMPETVFLLMAIVKCVTATAE